MSFFSFIHTIAPCCHSVVDSVVYHCCNIFTIGACNRKKCAFPKCGWAKKWQSCRFGLVEPMINVNNEFRGEKITSRLTNNKLVQERGDKILKGKCLDRLNNISNTNRVNVRVCKNDSHNSVLSYEIQSGVVSSIKPSFIFITLYDLP